MTSGYRGRRGRHVLGGFGRDFVVDLHFVFDLHVISYVRDDDPISYVRDAIPSDDNPVSCHTMSQRVSGARWRTLPTVPCRLLQKYFRKRAVQAVRGVHLHLFGEKRPGRDPVLASAPSSALLRLRLLREALAASARTGSQRDVC